MSMLQQKQGISSGGSFPGGQPFNVACSAALLGFPWALGGASVRDAIGRKLGSIADKF